MDITTNQCAVIVFPFYPFSSKFQKDFVEKLSFKQKISIYHFINLNDFNNYNDLINKILTIINTTNGKVILISFSIFSQIAGFLIKHYNEKIEGTVFIEPDFTNLISKKNYNYFFRKKDIKNKIIKLLTGNQKVNEKLIYHGNIDSFINILTSIADSRNSFKLYDFISTGVKFIVIWSAMQNECWPLPQVLSEDYNIPLLNIDKNIVSFLLDIDKINIDNI